MSEDSSLPHAEQARFCPCQYTIANWGLAVEIYFRAGERLAEATTNDDRERRG